MPLQSFLTLIQILSKEREEKRRQLMLVADNSERPRVVSKVAKATTYIFTWLSSLPLLLNVILFLQPNFCSVFFFSVLSHLRDTNPLSVYILYMYVSESHCLTLQFMILIKTEGSLVTN